MKNEQMKLKLKVIGIVLFMLIIIITFPLLIQWLLLAQNDFILKYSDEVWFGFIASYLGAIGTFLLGLLALYQNRQYKRQADMSNEQLLKLQEDIKELSRKNVELIEINTKIEKAKYYPIFTEEHVYHFNISVQSLEETFSENSSFQITIKKEDANLDEISINKVFEQYNTLVFSLKNTGEKVIRNFICTECTINNNHEMGFWLFYACDIAPGTDVNLTFATKKNLLKEIKDGNIRTLEFKYEMENVIGEKFGMNIEVTLYSREDGSPCMFPHIGSVYRK